MIRVILVGLETFNQLLTAGIAITAFSLLLHALTFNLRDRATRAFALILFCVMVVFVGDSISSVATSPKGLEFWLRVQWVGIVLLPPAYLHFSDAILTTTGGPWGPRRRLLTRATYLVSIGFLVALPVGWLAGPLVADAMPAPHLQRTFLTYVFTAYYIAAIVWAWFNFSQANRRTVTRTGKRRMRYLLAGALAPALGSYPYLLFGSALLARHPLIFWGLATFSNVLVTALIVVMAYSVSFFGVPWPDRVIKRRLAKWLLRGPVTAITTLAITTLVKRLAEHYNLPYGAAIPILTVATILVMEYAISLLAPLWERWLIFSAEPDKIDFLRTVQERLLTSDDLRQFLEAVLAAACDRLQVPSAFIASLEAQRLDMLVLLGNPPSEEAWSQDLLQTFDSEADERIYVWDGYWLTPLYFQLEDERQIIGLMGVLHPSGQELEEDQRQAYLLLARRAASALADHQRQQIIFSSLEALAPQMDQIQRLRAAARYDGRSILETPEPLVETSEMSRWVKDALTHYWGGPRLTESPLLRLNVVQHSVVEHDGNPANALRSILRRAIDQVRPEGERRFTGEWILYNILEMKFMEGHKVREIAQRLALSEADLYRKQRVAIEAVATAIREMEESIPDSDAERLIAIPHPEDAQDH